MGNAWKPLIAAALAALSVYLQQMLVPVVILGVVMILDYVSGVTAAWINNELSSAVGARGIVKKVGYLLLVAVGMVIDYMIAYGLAGIGIEIGERFLFALIVTIWLIINECLSIIENAAEIGLPVPDFIRSALLKMQRQVEKKNESEE